MENTSEKNDRFDCYEKLSDIPQSLPNDSAIYS